MLKFSTYFSTISEEKAPPRGIPHISHAREDVFGLEHHDEFGRKVYAHGPDVIKSTADTLRGVLSGTHPVTRKIDDRVSFQAIRHEDGRVGVKYKGPGAQYNYSAKDVAAQHGHKPYLAKTLGAVLQHIGKVLPNSPGEYQGGFLSAPEDRKVEKGKIKHTPNTVSYSVDKNSEEGQKLAGSKVSVVLHSMLDKEGRASPVPRNFQLNSHPDVHVMSHNVAPNEQNIPSSFKTKAAKHLDSIQGLLKGYETGHLHGHEQSLRQYANKTLDKGEELSGSGYINFLKDYHQKRIDAVKTEKAKQGKAAEREAAIAHVAKNGKMFERTFKLHNAIHQATNSIADGLNETAHGGVETDIEGKKSGHEGFVVKDEKGNIKKLVPEQFRIANRERSVRFRAPKLEEGWVSAVKKGYQVLKNVPTRIASAEKKVMPVEPVTQDTVRTATQKTPDVVVKIKKPEPVDTQTAEYEKAAKAAKDYFKRRELHKELLAKRERRDAAVQSINTAKGEIPNISDTYIDLMNPIQRERALARSVARSAQAASANNEPEQFRSRTEKEVEKLNQTIANLPLK